MDTPKEFTAIEWCAGYGGIHLGLKRAIPSLRVIAYGEIEAFACANLVAKMEARLLDPAPLWTDLKTFPCEAFRDRVDLLVAGYPCQPFSAAGKRLGTDDPRHLWPHIARAIRVIRPRLCFFENVEGHISLGLREVVGELESIGYQTTWGIFSASEVGAPHQRKRVFILAVSSSLGGAAGLSRSLAWDERLAGVADNGGGEGCGELADAGRIEPQGWDSATQGQQFGAGRVPRGEPAPRHDQVWPSRPGEPQHGWEPPRVVVANTERSGGEKPEHLDANLPSEPSGRDSEGLGNAEHDGLPSAEIAGSVGEESSEGRVQKPAGGCGVSDGAMGHTNSPRPQERQGQRGSAIQGADADGRADAERQTQQPMGHPVDGTKSGLGLAELSGLSHQELAEICEWMVRSDNRTDELRLLGNGVVPATAERAFRVLMEELFER